MMESDRILVAAGITAAAVVGAFVFWGPSTGSGSRRGRLAGLVNLGKTCFLNAVLHALAACPHFIAWLERDALAKETSLRSTLCTVLSVVNGTNKSVQDNFAPAAVINALKRLGWVIPSGEQDAHELLNVILTTLDEETQKMSRKAGCLSDALGMNELDLEDKDEDNDSEFNSMGSVMSLNELGRPLSWKGGSIRRNRWISRSCRALQMSGPPPQPATHPFSGTLTSQLRCAECGFKSPVRYDKFESLSLALPSGAGDLGWGRHKLHQLLSNFVTPEVVQDVQCEGCNKDRDPTMPPKLSRQIKILNFGKLPVCLCIHISRNTWQPGGISKRQDYVQFPMRLSMSAYTFIQVHYQRKVPGTQLYTSTSEGGSPLSSSTPLCWGGNTLNDMANEFRNVYQLAAVVVHTGDAHSGHFVTYRRGHHNSRWYYTSDIEIKEVTVDEVLQSTAYMLFYEKTASVVSAF